MLPSSTSKIKILVACHKEKSAIYQDGIYVPIQVGKELRPNLDLGILCDNTGNNISHKNESYCELTALYWVWKNLKDTDIIGLCHYRRYFDFHHQCKPIYPDITITPEKFNSLDLSVPDRIIQKVQEGNIVVAKDRIYETCLALDYCRCHISDDLYTLESIIVKNSTDKYIESFRHIMYHTNKLKHYNMFIMNRQRFDHYCAWLFSILNKVEQSIDISHYNNKQKRIFGYMAERLFNVYLHAEHCAVIQRPIIKVCEDISKEQLSSARLYLRQQKKNLAFWISNVTLFPQI